MRRCFRRGVVQACTCARGFRSPLILSHLHTHPNSILIEMAARNNGLCNNFMATGKCRFGNKCKFAHDRDSQSRSRSSTPGPSSGRAPPTPPPGQPSGVPRAPPRVCNFFWSSGTCSRGFECSFKHERSPSATSTTGSTAPDQEEEEPDFFSVEGLTAGNNSTRNEGHALTPSDAHNHLKAFLADNFRFENAAKVQGFVRILASINERNKAWVSFSRFAEG